MSDNIRALLVLTCLALPLTAQANDVVDLALTEQLVEINLDNAVVRVVLDPDNPPHLRARALQDTGAADGAVVDGPVVVLSERNSELYIERAAASANRRLQLDLTVRVNQPLVVVGRDLNVEVKGPPLDLEEMAMLRGLAREDAAPPEDHGGFKDDGPVEMLVAGETAEEGQAGGAGRRVQPKSHWDVPAPTWTAITLDLVDSQAEVFGLSGALLRGRNTWFVSRQSTNELQVELTGGAAEVEQHRGMFSYRNGMHSGTVGTDSGDLRLRDAMGDMEIHAQGGKLEVMDSLGKIEGSIREVEALFFSWRGQVTLESDGGFLEMRGFQVASGQPGGQNVNLTSRGTEVAIEGMERGLLKVNQQGGRLVLRDIAGKMDVEAGAEAELELERLGGAWRILLQNSQLRAEEVERLALEMYGAELEVVDAEGLELQAHNSQIDVSEIGRLGRVSLVNTVASIGLTEGATGQLNLQGESRANLSLTLPCAISVDRDPETELSVAGCQEGSAPEGLGSGDDGQLSMLQATMSGEARLEVRGHQL